MRYRGVEKGFGIGAKEARESGSKLVDAGGGWRRGRLEGTLGGEEMALRAKTTERM